MKKAKDLFEALAISTYELVNSDGGHAGFRIPEYQRRYDWSKENISRLCYNTLNGFARISESKGANSFTFLGTIILVREKSKEEDFTGSSFAVVDGQQRLTTLSLFACVLYEQLRQYEPSLKEFAPLADTSLREWLEKELEVRLLYLYECVAGAQKLSPVANFSFPRIIRDSDSRGKSVKTSEYQSAIARFLNRFAECCEKTSEFITPFDKVKDRGDTDVDKLSSNYKEIQNLIGNLNESQWYETVECEQFSIKAIKSAQCRQLFEKLSDCIKDEGDQNRVLDMIINDRSELHDFVRTLLFASYFCNFIVLTRVITGDESAAFDIFDALNTTGEPLTAIETLKPHAINFENKQGGYKGSRSEAAFETIDKNLDQRFSNTDKKQIETKDLMVTFRLYLEGRKLSKDLAAQRNFLRQSYDNAKNRSPESAQQFVESLADLTNFRRYYWEPEGIERLNKYHRQDTVQEVQLLVSFISDIRTSLALPIVARYWSDVWKTGNDSQFLEILRAVVGFILLRRAWTGGTDGIDGDFRAIMEQPTGSPGSKRKFGLCAGFDHANELLSPPQLKKALRELLEYKFKTLEKGKWVSRVAMNPLYSTSAAKLIRLMLLMAAHEAAPSASKLGLWDKSDVKPSGKNQFLDFKTWRDDLYAEVEHVAPSTEPKEGWDSGLYEDNVLRDTLGNLVLLPRKENAAIGNESWEKKRIFYLMLSTRSPSEVEKLIAKAKEYEISFTSETTERSRSKTVLHLLDPIRSVDEWNAELVKSRGENIAALCWEYVWPWLN